MSKKNTRQQTPQRELQPQDAPLAQLVIPQPSPVLPAAQAMLQQIKDFTVTDAASYAQLAEARSNISKRHDAVEKQRVDMKAPALEMGRKVDEFFKPALTALAEGKQLATDKLRDWDREQARIAEQKRREAEEAARQERIRTQRILQSIERFNREAQLCRDMADPDGINQAILSLAATSLDEGVYGEHLSAAKSAKDNALKVMRAHEQSVLARIEQERIAEEQRKAKEAGDAAAIEKAQKDAAVERARAVEARKAQMKAEEEAKRLQEQNTQLQQQSEQRAAELEHQAQTIEPERVAVAGLSRPKVTKWRLIDKMKLKPDLLLPDEKTINKLVITVKDPARLASMIGEGAIEVYQEEQLRQN